MSSPIPPKTGRSSTGSPAKTNPTDVKNKKTGNITASHSHRSVKKSNSVKVSFTKPHKSNTNQTAPIFQRNTQQVPETSFELTWLADNSDNKKVGSTVDHRIMRPSIKAERDNHLHGKWHVKSPGGVRIMERIKRRLVALFFSLVGAKKKATYYRDVKLLAEKEVLAGKLTREFLLKGDSYCSTEWNLDKQLHHNYHFDQQNKTPCVANQHIIHDHLASKEHAPNLLYDGENNPATAYIMRHFFLDDADCLKRENYLVIVAPLSEGHSFVPIDFGMAFYESFKIPETIDFENFLDSVFTPSLAYRIHYSVLKPGESIMNLINTMSREDRERCTYIALRKIAEFSEKDLMILTNEISNETERKQIFNQLLDKVNFAKKLCAQAITRPIIEELLSPPR